MRKIKNKRAGKKDRYLKARGGSFEFFIIHCSQCQAPIVLYQKDGPGALLRMYLDRIHEPSDLADLQNKDGGKQAIPNLSCPGCCQIIGVPMVYELEQRLAFRLIRGRFQQKRNDGTFPPSSK